MGLVLLTAGLAGCIQGTGEDVESNTAPEVGELDLEADNQRLWDDPQTASHPAYEYPTFTSIPNASQAPEYWQPIEPNEFDPTNVGIEHVADDPNDTSTYGTGIALFGELAIIPGRSTGNTSLYDISDTEAPELVSKFSAPGRDVDTIAFPDGRLYAIFATDQGELPIWNLSDPENPTLSATIEPDRGSHNVGVVPGTPIVYNSASLGGGQGSRVPAQASEGTAIYDLSNPETPELVQDFENGYSCHDISFSIREDSDEYRAYCAGIDMTQIWDIEDPENPEVVVNVPVHHGVAGAPSVAYGSYRFAHLAMADRSGDILIVGDEPGGGTLPACDAHASGSAAGTTASASGPVGNLYFYDVSDETNPVLQGWISADAPGLMGPDKADAACTAHFGRIIPSEDKDLLAMAFYTRGVNLVDFTDPANPTIVDQYAEDTNTWDVWYYNGYLVAGDITGGMDVFELASE